MFYNVSGTLYSVAPPKGIARMSTATLTPRRASHLPDHQSGHQSGHQIGNHIGNHSPSTSPHGPFPRREGGRGLGRQRFRQRCAHAATMPPGIQHSQNPLYKATQPTRQEIRQRSGNNPATFRQRSGKKSAISPATVAATKSATGAATLPATVAATVATHLSPCGPFPHSPHSNPVFTIY